MTSFGLSFGEAAIVMVVIGPVYGIVISLPLRFFCPQCTPHIVRSPGTATLYGLSPQLLLKSEKLLFMVLTPRLIFALGNRAGLTLLIQTHDTLEQALLAGSERLPLCQGKRSWRILWPTVLPSLIARDYNPQVRKADHESIGCYPEKRSRTHVTEELVPGCTSCCGPMRISIMRYAATPCPSRWTTPLILPCSSAEKSAGHRPSHGSPHDTPSHQITRPRVGYSSPKRPA